MAISTPQAETNSRVLCRMKFSFSDEKRADWNRFGIIRDSAFCVLCRYRHKTHWTGHPKRLNRKLSTVFGSSDYSFEELVAEIGGAFLSGHIGYEYDTRHAAYVQHWTKVLKADNRAIFRAASLAQSAADLLLGVKFEKKEEAA